MIQDDGKRLLLVGAELQNGKYVVQTQISSGGFGNTYVVVDKTFEAKLALKEFFIKGVNERNDDNTTISISNSANRKLFESQKEKFKKEAKRLRMLNNRHIVRVYDLFEENNTAYYVMDYIEGESLSNRLKTTKTPLSEKEAMNIFIQVLDALEEAHNLKIWHLDLKPGNILVDKRGNVVLIDFGASKQLSTGEGYETTTSSMCYTPGYAPAEQIDQNMDRIGPWTDLYALGATLYNLITCTPPPTTSELNEPGAFVYPANISQQTRNLVEWMMKPNRNMRPQSVADVRRYLETPKNSSASSIEEDTIIERENVGGEKVVHDKSARIKSVNPSVDNKMRGWTLGIIFGLLSLLIVFGLWNGCENRAQAPIEEDVDSIAEVVDSVVDSLWVDSIVADDWIY